MRQPHKKLYWRRDPKLDAAIGKSIVLLAGVQCPRLFVKFFIRATGEGYEMLGAFTICFLLLILSATAVWATLPRHDTRAEEQALRRKRFKNRRKQLRSMLDDAVSAARPEQDRLVTDVY